MPEFQVAVVDAFGATSGFAAAFGAVGGGVIQVQSTVDLLPGVTPVDPAKFSHTVVHDGDTDALTEKIAALRPRAVLAGRESGWNSPICSPSGWVCRPTAPSSARLGGTNSRRSNASDPAVFPPCGRSEPTTKPSYRHGTGRWGSGRGQAAP